MQSYFFKIKIEFKGHATVNTLFMMIGVPPNICPFLGEKPYCLNYRKSQFHLK